MEETKLLSPSTDNCEPAPNIQRIDSTSYVVGLEIITLNGLFSEKAHF